MRPHDKDNQQIWGALKEANEYSWAMNPSGDGDKPDPELSRVPPEQGLDRDLNDAEGRPIETGDIVELGMSDRKYVVVDFGGGSVEIAELGPTKGYDAAELKVVGELGG